MALTLKTVEKLKSEPGRYSDGHGLYLQIVSPTNCSWLFRYERGGRERWMGLGATHTFALPEARERARKARQQLADGIDPLDARRADEAQSALTAAKALTFKEAAERYYSDHEHRWTSSKHSAQFFSTLREYAYHKLRTSVADIDTGLILDVLKQPVAAKRNLPGGMFYIVRPETAARVRQRIEAVLDWCAAHKYRSGGDNPARREVVKAGLPERSAKVKHFASMSYSDVPSFIADLRGREGIAARALELCILSGARTNEIIGATWDEIDLAEKVWRIPAARMKAREDHRVALSDRAVEILAGLPRERGNAYLFIGPRKDNISSAAMASVLRRMGRDNVTVHGFRSSFRTWGEECTSYPHIVLEMALAHKVDGKVVQSYRRTDLLEKRRRLMTDWSRYCASPAKGEVVPLRRAAK